MDTLYNVITYNHQHYATLTDEKARREVEKLIGKLQYLESEIMPVTEGTINLSPTGNVFINNFPPALHRKINQV
jgi:hypothetical protein